MVLNDQLVGGDADVERVVLTPTVSFDLPFFLGSEVSQNLETWTPALKLKLPVHYDGCRHDDQVWTPNTIVAGQRRQQPNSLNGFTKTHFVS